MGTLSGRPSPRGVGAEPRYSAPVAPRSQARYYNFYSAHYRKLTVVAFRLCRDAFFLPRNAL